jgi:IclR family transcriptional regulator, acetate operon repressor
MKERRVKSATRVLKLFDVFAVISAPLTLTELARELQIPTSSCFQLIRSLLAEGYLYQIGSRRFYPSKKFAQVANAIAAHDPIQARFMPFLEELRARTDETAILSQMDGTELVYLLACEGTHMLRVSISPGHHAPLHSTASGKALLSGLPEEDLLSLLGQLPMPRTTSATICEREVLLTQIRERRDSVHYARGERFAYLMGMAICIPAFGGIFAISVGGPIERLEAKVASTEATLLEIRERLRRPAGDVSGVSLNERWALRPDAESDSPC